MDFFPAFLNLRNTGALVVGGGMVAARKVDLLRSAGARVLVVAETLCAELENLHEKGAIEQAGRVFHEDMVSACAIVVAATSDRELNRTVARCCRARGILVNVVDDPELCSFITPAILDRSPLIIALSTGGNAPVLARQLKARLATLIPPAYGRLARLAGSFRAQVMATREGASRRRFWEHVFTGPVARDMLAGREQQARTKLCAALEQEADLPEFQGEVSLVGAGPGDPELLTLGALRLMQEADVVLYDRLVSSEVLALARRDAEQILVGKHKSTGWAQKDINAKLVELARQGRKVVRLKGGDPCIFGRSGDEIQALVQQGIAFRIVPGISAAQGCAAYAGIGLTHREYARSVQFLTAHPRQDGTLSVDWKALDRPGQTLVFYMGRAVVRQLCRELIANGLPEDTPAALVENGTLPEQRVLRATLHALPDMLEGRIIAGPGLIIVGQVAGLRHVPVQAGTQSNTKQD